MLITHAKTKTPGAGSFSIGMLALILVLPACKSGDPDLNKPAIGYVLGVRKSTPIHAKPAVSSTKLGELSLGKRVELLVKAVKDPAKPSHRWLKVRVAESGGKKVVGYIQERGDLRPGYGVFNREIAQLEVPKTELFALIKAEQKRARSRPNGKSNITFKSGAPLKVLARGRVVSFKKGANPYGDEWLLLRGADGKEGYALEKNLFTGSRESVAKRANMKTEPMQGWVRIIAAKPRFLNEPGGRPVQASDPAKCDHKLDKYPGKGGFAPVVEKASLDVDGKPVVFYHVRDEWSAFMECAGAIDAWIAASEVEQFTDFFQYSLKASGAKADPAMLRAANGFFGGNLNVFSVKVKEVKILRDPGDATFHQIIGFTGHRGPRVMLLMARRGGSFSKLGLFKGGQSPGHRNHFAGEFRDLDGDGNMELITNVTAGDGNSYHIHAHSSGRYRKVLDVGTEGSGGDDPSISFKGPHVFCYNACESRADSPWSNSFQGRNLRVMEFAGGRFTEVDAARKGLKKPANTNAPAPARN